jgi:hypothetical protein
MPWEPPRFDEIKMDAELSAYCDDVEEESTAHESAPPGPYASD